MDRNSSPWFVGFLLLLFALSRLQGQTASWIGGIIETNMIFPKTFKVWFFVKLSQALQCL
jgi:hypothetical protein